MKSSKILLNVATFFCFIYFAIYIFTLVFIPIGIYCFLAGKLFDYKASHLDDTMKYSNQQFKNYVIFVSIFCFPFGLLAIIPYKYLTSNNIVVSSVKTEEKEETSEGSLKINNESAVEKNNENEVIQEKLEETPEEVKEETMEEKMEKFKKLQRFKENGFITEEELEQAREQLFGKQEQ